MTGKIIIDKPALCNCVIDIDGDITKIDKKEYELPYGTYKINVGITYEDLAEKGKEKKTVTTWAWKSPHSVNMDGVTTKIKIVRKVHIVTPLTAEATITRLVKQ